MLVGRTKIYEDKMNIRQILKNRDKFNLDVSIQRDKVWDIKRKSDLIDSIVKGIANIYPIVIYDKYEFDGEFDVYDGVQRLSTIFEYFNDEFKLKAVENIYDDLDEIEEEDEEELEEGVIDVRKVNLKGYKFSDIQKRYPELADEMLDTVFNIVSLRNMSFGYRVLFFQRLNNGVPLSRQEISRIAVGEEGLEWFKVVTKMPFFEEKLNMGAKIKSRKGDEEVLVQCVMLDTQRENIKGFDERQTKLFQKQIKKELLTDELKKEVDSVFSYLYDVSNLIEESLGDEEENKKIAIEERKNIMKKIHMPMLYVVTKKAIENKISKEDFMMWLTRFFKNMPQAYKDTLIQNTAQKKSILTRLHEMEASFNEKFNLSTQTSA